MIVVFQRKTIIVGSYEPNDEECEWHSESEEEEEDGEKKEENNKEVNDITVRSVCRDRTMLPIPLVLKLTYFYLFIYYHWFPKPISNAFVSESGKLWFKSQTGQIKLSIVISSPSLAHFMERRLLLTGTMIRRLPRANSLHASAWNSKYDEAASLIAYFYNLPTKSCVLTMKTPVFFILFIGWFCSPKKSSAF